MLLKKASGKQKWLKTMMFASYFYHYPILYFEKVKNVEYFNKEGCVL